MPGQRPHQCADPSRCSYCKRKGWQKEKNQSGKCAYIACDLPVGPKSTRYCEKHHEEGLQKAQSQYKTRREESQTLKRCRKCPKPLAPGDKSFCVDHTKTQKVTDGKQQKKRTERKAAAETNGRLDQPSSDTQEAGQDVSSGMGFEDYMSMALATSPAHDSASYYAPSTEPWMLPENPAQGLESTSNPYLSNAHTSSSPYGEPYDQVTQGFFADAMYMHDVYGDTLDGGVVQQSSDYSTQTDFQASGMDNIPFDYDNSNLPGWYTQPSNPPGY